MADSSSVSIVIPALDEAATMSDVVVRLRVRASWREVIVVDDGSSDTTAPRKTGARPHHGVRR